MIPGKNITRSIVYDLEGITLSSVRDSANINSVLYIKSSIYDSVATSHMVRDIIYLDIYRIFKEV